MKSEPYKKTLYWPHTNATKQISEEDDEQLNGALYENTYFKEKFGTDEAYNRELLKMYDGEQDMQETLRNMTTIQAYNKAYQTTENKSFINAVRMAIGTSDWDQNPENPGDYREDKRKYFIDILTEIPEKITRDLKERKQIAQEEFYAQAEIKPWELNIGDERYAEILGNEENYSDKNIAAYELDEKNFKRELEAAKKPGQILDVIEKYWDYLWKFQCSYEAVEFCIALSENITDNTIIRKKLRNFTKDFSKRREFIQQLQKYVLGLEENSNFDQINRIATYADAIAKLTKK